MGIPYSDKLAFLDAEFFLHTTYALIGENFSQVATAKQAVKQEAWLNVSHSIALTSRIWICTVHNQPSIFSGSAVQRLKHYSNQITASGENIAPPLPTHIAAIDGQDIVQSSTVDRPTAQQETELVNGCKKTIEYPSAFSFFTNLG